ncbi:MAG: FG-GAP-like repeat-containing protein [Fluviicola sp.]
MGVAGATSIALMLSNNAEAQFEFRAGLGVQTNVTSYVGHAVLADMDNDGDLDIMQCTGNQNIDYSENIGSSTDFYFEDVATPSFGASAPAGTFLTSCAVVDMDGDGDLDVMAAEYYGGLYYFENTGTANNPDFPNNVSAPFGVSGIGYYSRMGMADIDSDGDYDLFVSNYGNIQFYENIGTTSAAAFAAPVTNPFNIAITTSYGIPSFSDMDNDGDLDMILGANSFEYLENVGNSTTPNFGTSQSNYFPITNGVSALGDLDGDNDLDAVIVKSVGFRKYSFLRNIGSVSNPSWQPETNEDPFGIGYVIGGGNPFANPTFTDLDNDGDLDMLSGRQNGDFEYNENLGSNTNPNFAGAILTNPFGLADLGTDNTPVFVDLDGDGDMDIWSSLDHDSNSQDFWFHENIGDATNPSYAPAVSGINFNIPSIGSLCGGDPQGNFVDLDNDGDQDFVYIICGPSLGYFENFGSATSPNFTGQVISPFNIDVSGLPASSLYNLDFSDIDNDGDFDMIVTAGNSSFGYAIFENIGTPNAPDFAAPVYDDFGLKNLVPSVSSNNWNTSSFVDFDGDGDEDLFTWLSDRGYYFENSTSNVPPPCTISIPDATFKAYLVGQPGINTNGNGEIECSEAIAFTGQINCTGLGIADLTGIEEFVNITSLWCFNNPINALDVSNNVALTDLACSDNNLISLDVSNNTNLIELQCSSNQLGTLDVSALTNLEILRCSDNPLGSIDVSNNTSLHTLWCWNTQLTTLNLSSNTNMDDLSVSENQLTTLDFSMLSNLTRLYCNDMTTLTELNVTNGNNTNVVVFELTDVPNLTCVEVDDAAYSTTNWTNIDGQVQFSEDCASIGLEELNTITLSAVPNPTSNKVTVSGNGAISRLELMDMSGKHIYSVGGSTASLSEVTPGIYLLKVLYEGGSKTMRIVKE